MPAAPAPDAARTRARILAAACEIARSGDGGRVSVRAVAGRAGVGIGTLRFHFPTQRALHDAVLAAVYAEAMPDERIHDTTLPATHRLLECLRHVLDPVGTGERAREVWTRVVHAYVDPATASNTRGDYLDLSREVHRRVESWLAVLVTQGGIAPGDTAARARYLLTVVNGLAVQRALPSDGDVLEHEREVLEAAVRHVVG